MSNTYGFSPLVDLYPIYGRMRQMEKLNEQIMIDYAVQDAEVVMNLHKEERIRRACQVAGNSRQRRKRRRAVLRSSLT